MAEQGKKRDDQGTFEQDPFVDRLRPEPSTPPAEVATLEGLAGKSDRDGWARIYFNTSLTYYAEFRREDVAFTEAIPPEQPPMPGLKCTRVGVKKDAVIEYTRSTRARTRRVRSRFAADIRSSEPGATRHLRRLPGDDRRRVPDAAVRMRHRSTCGCHTGRTDCVCPTLDTCRRTVCVGHTCIEVCDTNTCPTVCGATCNTCQTRCNQPTCGGTCNTCRTQCGQATCATCRTQCGQATCNTCRTNCDQATCDTCGIGCRTNNPHVFTCGQCVGP